MAEQTLVETAHNSGSRDVRKRLAHKVCACYNTDKFNDREVTDEQVAHWCNSGADPARIH